MKLVRNTVTDKTSVDSTLTLSKTPGESPLEQLINSRLTTRESTRWKYVARLFEAFHLKNTITTEVDGRNITVNDKSVVNFGSANYLGLELHSKIIQSSIEGLKRFGNHSGCSRIFSSHENILKLEDEIADLMSTDKALVGTNVSQIHMAVIPTVFANPDTVFFLDRYAHTSMYLASQVAVAKGAKLKRTDVSQLSLLKKSLRKSKQKHKVVLIDGVYSMQGHCPDLLALEQICKEEKAILYIDDAHGIGIMGRNGGGVVEEYDLCRRNTIIIGSLQKGLGTFGGFVAGNSTFIDILRSQAKAQIFCGALQPHAVEGARAAIAISKSEEGHQLRESLKGKSRHLRRSLREAGYDLRDGDSPIISVEIGPDFRTLMSGRKLFDLGFFVNSVLFPAVPQGEGLIRISLNANHSDEQIDQLISAFVELQTFIRKNSNKATEGFKYAHEILKSKVLGRNYAGL